MASNIPGGYIVVSNEPIDSRVQTQSTSSRDSRLVANMHEGLITFVKENGLLYVLTNTGSGSPTDTIGNSANSVWKQIATTDMLGGGGGGSGGNTFATMSIFNGTSTTFILSDSPSASLFISTSNQNLTITPNAGTDTITFGFSSTPIFTAVTASDILITNNLVVGGRVTAQEFHTEFVSASIIYESGSTKFGNSSDDIHEFTGSIRQSNSDSYFLGNVGIGTTSPTNTLQVVGSITTTNLTASGNISSSAGLIGQTLDIIGNGTIGGTLGVTGLLSANGALTTTNLTASGNISSSAGLIGQTLDIIGNGTIGGTLGVTGLLSANGALTTTNLTASGNISSSAGLIGQTLDIIGNGTIGGTLGVTGLLSANGALTTTNLTASGNISSSAGLIGQTLTTSGNGTIGGNLTANSVRIPNTLVVSGSTILGDASTTSDTLTINSTTTINDNLSITGSLFVNGNTKLGSDFQNHNITVESNKIFSSNAISGFTGNGWLITRNQNNITTLDIDNINVRNSLSAVTFLAQQIRATNGSVYVSSAGRVNSTSSLGFDVNTSKSFGLIFETGSGIDGHGFQLGDVIRAQRTSTTMQYKSDMIVKAIQSISILTASLMNGSAEPQSGYDYVKLGNTSSISDRRGTVYLTSDDSNSPFIDVIDGVQSHQDWDGDSSKIKVRMGNLGGMTSPTFDGLNGYGLYASGSVYLEGGINATLGKIAGWNISSSKIEKRNIELNSDQSFARFGDGVTLTQNTGVFLSGSGEIMIGNASDKRISFINNDLYINSTNFTLQNGNITASNATLSGTITANAGAIGGWNITSTAITRSNVELNSSNNFIRLGAVTNLLTGSGIFLSGSGETLIGSASGHRISFIGGNLILSASNAVLKGNTVEISGSNFHLLNGSISASNATLSGTITANAGRIGGFAITQDAITGSAFFLSGSATGAGFFISASNFNVKANGQVTGSNVLFTGGKVGGFNLSSDAISGAGFFLSGSATGNDFFISSSNFNVKANGQVTGSNVLFTGGKVGGFNLSSDAISGAGFFLSGSATGDGFFISASNFNVKANGQLTGSNVLFTGGKIGGFTLSSDAISGAGFFLSGSATGNDFFISSSNFNVKANGNITASNATLSGTITANAGTIGGWRITDSQISSSGIILTTSSAEDNNAAILIGSATKLNTGSGIFLNGMGYFRVGDPNGKRILWDTNDLLISSSNFTLINGNITASNATLSGTITANAGRIGGFAITQDAITGSGFFLSGSATGDGFFISASNFNVKANGTITASAGLIGGFNTTSDKIESTGSFTSGSFTSPYISLKANGQITGSDVLLRRLHSDGKVYNHFDTTTGIIDARNIGRQVVQHYNGMTLVGGTNNVWYESSDCYYPIQLLQGENALLISFSLLGQTGNGSAPNHYAKITLSSASFSSTIVSDNSLFDNWGGEMDVLQKSFNSIAGTRSQVITPSGSGAVVSIPESYQGKYCLLKLELMQSSTPGSTTTTAVRGLTITTTRTFAANVASGSGFILYQEKYNL